MYMRVRFFLFVVFAVVFGVLIIKSVKNVLYLAVFPFVPVLLAIVLSVLHRCTLSEYPLVFSSLSCTNSVRLVTMLRVFNCMANQKTHVDIFNSPM
jgi:hypothetical protein